ncbi:DUF4878 domain-containing protein [Longirhabdus pacifica]|uniref:DUF4878 domain-containing protein n=1 Tax=Longirhabdus pacifica TaxID=2305227 RepID=UPI0013E8EFBC|nr:DUF4878 domain-containing protein [Longirhabdus pacifica]
MNRLVFFFMMFSLFLAACSQENQAEQVINSFISAAGEGNVEKMFDYISDSSIAQYTDENTSVEQMKSQIFALSSQIRATSEEESIRHRIINVKDESAYRKTANVEIIYTQANGNQQTSSVTFELDKIDDNWYIAFDTGIFESMPF